MRITLFLQSKILEFFLPSQISGSYSFDENIDEETKIINIEAKNGKWILYGKENISVLNNNVEVKELELEVNQFYLIKKEDTVYLIYTSPIFEENFLMYTYNNQIDLMIGNSSDCSIKYSCPFLNEMLVEICHIEGQLKIAHNQKMFLYINDQALEKREEILNYGDIINILGLKILILPNILIFNNPNNSLLVNAQLASILPFVYEAEEYKNIDVKDIDLYTKEEYFSKSPRIRRIIEEKEIELDSTQEEHAQEEMPLLLTIGPMISMGAMSSMNLLSAINQVSSGSTTLSQSLPRLVSSGLMLTTSLLWPILTKAYNKHITKIKERTLYEKYLAYLEERREELKKEEIIQKNILCENLINEIDCLNIINTKKNNFWCKRTEQNDFLEVRIGIGDVPLKVKIDPPKEGFTIEQSELKKKALELTEEFKYIKDTPVGYSLYENYLTAIMGVERKCYGLTDNILLQLMTFYCYDELKIIVFTSKDKEKSWNYLKYSNYCFSNDKTQRYFATNIEEGRNVCSNLLPELSFRVQNQANSEVSSSIMKPHYLIICDNYSEYKKLDFFEILTEVDKNIGYSTIILENALSKLPSKCVNFINLNEGSSGILKNSYEDAEITNFRDEINYNINMMEVTRMLSNIPIEIEGAATRLPDSISFLEMEKVGKVEQLNILNRWNTNDSTKSLKAEVGVDEEGNFMYLDLHEKFHGPHGLIAGMTGSGKSEFIISYILSMAMNYSPDDIAFILIDYKGGGLAFAFENKSNGIKLPHLAGTITNLDKSEMNRTLVSIDSEVKRRQHEFNKARDILGESTIDIYKYQSYYHEGKLKEAIPHLFIISDEFAELKSQQPEFMDNLISVARIGRSLGVHLILATQKPSGVVNDQIWSNSKFKVCLKVQDASDSNEMLKKPDAAYLKQTGRFYLQVGFDEYFALGQSAWAGAKYYPSDKIQKQIDKSVNIISNEGQVIKSAQIGNNKNVMPAQGEQLASILKEIINVSKQVNKGAKRLWLENIPNIITIDNVEKKYNVAHNSYDVEAIIGEYDAPELQQQGVVKYNLINDGNTLIYSTDGGERELMLNSIIYSLCKNHTSEEINIYTIDYGSEALRIFSKAPHVGGMVFSGETEKYNNLLKMLREEVNNRKKLFVDYGGSYENYIKNSEKKLPIKLIIINSYDNAKDNISSLFDELPEYVRDSARYGIIYIVTLNGVNSATSRLTQNFTNVYAMHLKEIYSYTEVLGTKVKYLPQENEGRGIINNNGAHEFQTALLTEDTSNLNEFVSNFIEKIKEQNPMKAKKIPTLPEHVMLEDVQEYIKDLSCIPIGISRDTLEPITINAFSNLGNIFSSNKIKNMTSFTQSLIELFNHMKVSTILIDAQKELEKYSTKVSNYYKDTFDNVLESIITYVENKISDANSNTNVVLIIFGLEKLITALSDIKRLEYLFEKIKKYEKMPIFCFEEGNKLKTHLFDSWYKKLFVNTEGLWIGSGVMDQGALKVGGYNKEYNLAYPNDMGFYVSEGRAQICKLIDFHADEGADKNE